MHRPFLTSFVHLAAVFVLSAGLVMAQPTAGLTLVGNGANSFLGDSTALAGDVNNDGVNDFIAGSPIESNNGPVSGSITVFSGVDSSVLYYIQGAGGSSVFGTSVSGCGDLNNDGFDDFMGSAPGIFLSGVLGTVSVYSGIDGSVLYNFLGDATEDRFGFSIANAGDVNMDGTNDIIVGAIQDDDNGVESGSARIFSGVDGSILLTILGNASMDFFGFSVAAAGDVNADGFADVFVGAPGSDNNGSDCGSSSVYSGFDGSLIYSFDGDSAGDQHGWSVKGAGDVNFDFIPDFVVGAPMDDDNGTDSGSCRVYSGADGTVLFSSFGDAAGDNFGNSVSGAGDVDRDLFDDIIVGAMSADNAGVDSGGARILSGFDGSTIANLDGNAAGDQFGISVNCAGDHNNDAFADVIVGARFAAPGGVLNAGSVTLFLAEAGPVLAFEAVSGPTELLIRWTPDSGNLQSVTGTMSCYNATPGAIGLFGVSLTPVHVPLSFGFSLLIAIDPINLIDQGNFGFSVFGDVHVPGLSRQAPSLAGIFVFIQFYEISPFQKGSNGIAMLLTP